MSPNLKPGDVIDVVVTQLEPYGAWIRHHDRVGLINIPELTWGWISHPSDVVQVGQQLRVRVLRVTDKSYSASLRALHPEQNPWRNPPMFIVGAEFIGPVVQVMAYGVFVDLVEGERGLIRLEEGKSLPPLGQRVRARIVEVDAERRRIILSWMENVS